MRDIVLMSFLCIGVLAALRRPWLGILLWVWVSLMNPHRFTYGFAYDAPVAAMAAGSVLLGLLLTKERDSPFKGTPASLMVALTVWITISWLMGLDVADDFQQWDKVMKINIMVLMALVLLRTKEHIFALVWVMTMSIAILGSKGGVFTIINGGSYRVWGPPGSFVGGNNEFAVAVIMTIPLLRFMQMQVRNRWLSRLLLLMMVLSAAAALGSHSRGALLAVVGMGTLLWWRGKSRLVNGVLFLVLGLLLTNVMPAEWFQRMDTIETYGEDASALGRLSAWWVAWRIGLNYPFGVGFNAARIELFLAHSPYPQFGALVAHSIFFQMMGHHGFVGFLLFVGLWLATWMSAARIRKIARDIPQAKWCADMASMCQVCIVGYLVGGGFLQLGYYDFPYYVMVLVVLTRAWVDRKAWETESPHAAGWRAVIGIGTPPPRQPAKPGSPGAPGAPGAPSNRPGPAAGRPGTSMPRR